MTRSYSFKSSHAALAFALWLVTAVYLICNLGHTQLIVDVASNADDHVQAYYSRNAQWNEPESARSAMLAGRDEIALDIPGLILGSVVRLDPGRRATTYHIFSVRWRLNGVDIPVPLSTIVNARPDASDTTTSADELLVSSRDNNPQLNVPTPGLVASIAHAHWAVGLSLMTFAFLLFAVWRRTHLPLIAAVFLATCAILYFLSCILVGPRLPLLDDWRYLLPGPCNLIDGHWQWLTVVGNDTYFLTNQILDFVVLKATHQDFAWLRGFAATVLLLQLVSQYRLLARTANQHPAIAALAVALGIWSLAGGGYWSNAAIAYQQALPTLFGTWILIQLVDGNGQLRPNPSNRIILICCVASGLAYISGGLLIASLGAAVVLVTGRRSDSRFAARTGGLLLGAGTLLLLTQFTLVSAHQGSLLEHNHHSTSVYPTDHRFWLFFLALYGRALGYNGVWVPADFFLMTLTLFPAAALGCLRLRAWNSKTGPESLPAWTMLAIYAGIGSASYAAMVAFGRAGFADANTPAVAVTAMGKGRFHFWPIAAMLPYVWLGWAVLLKHIHAGRTLASATIGVMLLTPKSLSLLDDVGWQRDLNLMARDGAACVVEHLPDAEAGKPVICTDLTSVPVDIGPTLLHLRDIGSRVYTEIVEEGTHAQPGE